MNVRMMAIGTLFASGAAFGAVSTANYVQDGLVVMLDGIANAAGGAHDATATTWTDLKGGLSSAVQLKGGYTWGADGITFDGSTGWGKGPKLTFANTCHTLELAVRLSDPKTTARAGWPYSGWDAKRPMIACSKANNYWSTCGFYGDGKGSYGTAAAGESYTVASVLSPVNADIGLWVNGEFTKNQSGGVERWSGETLNSLRLNATCGDGDNDGAIYGNCTYHAFRVYDRALTALEVAMNRAVDLMRFYGKTAEEASATLPEGYRFNDEESRFESGVIAVSGQPACGSVQVGEAAAGATSAVWSAVGAEVETVTVKALPASGYVFVRWVCDPAILVDGTLGDATVSVTTDAPKSLTAVFVAEDSPVRLYVQNGLAIQLDAIDNAGTGSHDAGLTTWYDLKGTLDKLTFTGGSAWTNGKGLTFDGTTGYAKGAKYTMSTKSRTFEAVVSLPAGETVPTTTVGFPHWNWSRQKPAFSCSSEDDSWWVLGFVGGVSGNGYGTVASGTAYHLASVMDSAKSKAGVWVNGTYTAGPASPEFEAGETAANFYMNYLGDSVTYVSPESAKTGSRIGGNATYHAYRAYDRALTDEEIARNRAVDRMRFFGADTATASAGLPDGLRLNVVAQRFEYRLQASSADAMRGTVSVSGMKVSPDGWVAEGATDTVVQAQAADGYAFVRWAGDLAAIVGGTAGTPTVTVKADRAIALTAVFEPVDASSRLYIQKGLIVQYDGIDNFGTGAHVADADAWYDLKGGAGKAALTGGYAWSESKGITFTAGSGYAMGSTTVFPAVPRTVETALKLADPQAYTVIGWAYGNWDEKKPFFTFKSASSGSTAWWYYGFAGDLTESTSTFGSGTPGQYQQLSAVTKAKPTKSGVWVNGTWYERSVEIGTAAGETYDTFRVNMGGSGWNPGLGTIGGGSTYYAFRAYDRALTDVETGINRVIDNVRFGGQRPEDQTYPDGFGYDSGTGKYTYRVSASAPNGGGTVKVADSAAGGSSQIVVAWRSAVQATATPGSGQYFDHWEIGDAELIAGGLTDVSITVAGETPIALKAYFAGDWSKTMANGTKYDYTYADRTLAVTVPAGVTDTTDYAAWLKSGVDSFVKRGDGTLQAVAADDYSGEIVVEAGVLQVSGAGQLGAVPGGAVIVRAGGAVMQTGSWWTSSRTVGKTFRLAGTGPADVMGALIVRQPDVAATLHGHTYVLDDAATICLDTGTMTFEGGCIDVAGHALTIHHVSTFGPYVYFQGGLAVTNSVVTPGAVKLAGASVKWDIRQSSWLGGAQNVLDAATDCNVSCRLLFKDTAAGDWTLKTACEYVGGKWSPTMAPLDHSDYTCSWGGGLEAVGRIDLRWCEDARTPTGSCFTVKGPVSGAATAELRTQYGWVNFLGNGHTYEGAFTMLGGSTATTRSGVGLGPNAAFPVGAGKVVAMTDSDLELDETTAYALPAFKTLGGTCTFSGGPAGDAACGRATMAALTVAGGETHLLAPVRVTGAATVTGGTLALAETPLAADALPVFGELKVAGGTFAANGQDVTAETLSASGTVSLADAPRIKVSRLTLDGTAVAAGGVAISGELVFDANAEVSVVNRRSAGPGPERTLVRAARITGCPEKTADGKWTLNVSADGTLTAVPNGGLAVIVR